MDLFQLLSVHWHAHFKNMFKWRFYVFIIITHLASDVRDWYLSENKHSNYRFIKKNSSWLTD